MDAMCNASVDICRLSACTSLSTATCRGARTPLRRQTIPSCIITQCNSKTCMSLYTRSHFACTYTHMQKALCMGRREGGVRTVTLAAAE